MNTWGLRGTLAAIAVAAVVGGLGGAGIYAATGATVGDRHGGPGFGFGGPEGPGGPPGRAGGTAAHQHPEELHGTSVVGGVIAGPGGVHTELTQTGAIVAITATAVSARSADGFTQTYAIPTTVTPPPLTVGDEVVIHASQNASGQPTVATIRPRATN